MVLPQSANDVTPLRLAIGGRAMQRKLRGLGGAARPTCDARAAEGIRRRQHARAALAVGRRLRAERVLEALAGVADVLARLIDADVLAVQQRGGNDRGP